MEMADIYIPDELKNTLRPVEELEPYENNPVSHSDRQREEVRTSIREFSFLVPVLAKDEDGEIADGHLRLEEGKKLGMRKIPVLSVDHLSEDEIKAFRIAVQKTAYDGEFIEGRLGSELEDLSNVDIDITYTGFTEEEVDDILREVDIDEFFEEEQEEEDEDTQPDLVECPECGHRFEV